MKIARRSNTMPSAETDMTPMIDMCFQLIAFFAIAINFNAAEQDLDVRVPSSELAKPPEESFDPFITIQMKKDGEILFGAKSYNMQTIGEALRIQTVVMDKLRKDKSKTTIIIRADKNAKSGLVQELIRKCQNAGFERFSLKAKLEKA